MLEESIEEKQQYLRSEIIDQGFDPQEFGQFMATIREGDLDLDKWTMSDLQNVVQNFKSKKSELPQQQNQQEQTIQQNSTTNNLNSSENVTSSQKENSPKKENNNIKNNETETKKKSEEIQDKTETNIPKSQSQIYSVKKSQNANSETQRNNSQYSNPKFKNLKDPFENHNELIKCIKLIPSELANRSDLYITISNPKKINPGIFSASYYQYNVKTSPVEYNVVRKLDDFTFLYSKLPLLYPELFNPLLQNFEFGLKDDSPKKMLYIQNYMNAIVENSFYRSLPIIQEFLQLPQESWNKKRINYNNIKQVSSFSKMTNLTGEINIVISKEQDTKAMKIKEDINKKTMAYDNLNSGLDDLQANIEKLSFSMKNVSNNFMELRNQYKNNDLLSDIFNRLFTLANIWSIDLMKQRDYFRDEIKYYFRYISKEDSSFLKNFDDFRLGRDDYKSQFEKLRNNVNRTQKDFNDLSKVRQYYGFLLCNLNQEFQKLEERQSIRTWSKFLKYNDNKDIIMQNYYNCIKLFNLKEEFPTKTKKNEENNKIETKENKNNIKDENEENKKGQVTQSQKESLWNF